MSKISELSDGGSLQSTDYLIAVRSGGNVKVRPNGAVSGTTGQFSTSLNVDGTVTADGVSSDGNISMSGAGTGSRYVILGDETNTYAGSLVMQAGGGSAAYGGSVIAYGHSHATKPGDIVAGISSGSGGSFRVNTSGIDGGADVLVVKSTGNVGIGTTPASGVRLDIRSNAAATLGDFRNASSTGFGLYVAAGDTDSQYAFRAADYQNNALVTITGAGNLLVGGTTVADLGTVNELISLRAGHYLQIAQTGTGTNTLAYFYNGNGLVGSISTSGSITAYNISSDARLKENVTDAEDASSLVDAIKVRQFDWKADGSHQRYGMVAQELMTVAPEAVSGDPESDDMMGVDYSKLVPMLVKEIQSLRARVAQLEGA